MSVCFEVGSPVAQVDLELFVAKDDLELLMLEAQLPSSGLTARHSFPDPSTDGG